MIVKRQITQDDINEFVRRGGPLWLFTKKEVENIPLDLIRPQYYAGTFDSALLSEERRKILDEELEKDPSLKKNREESIKKLIKEQEEEDKQVFDEYSEIMDLIRLGRERDHDIYYFTSRDPAARIIKLAFNYGDVVLRAAEDYWKDKFKSNVPCVMTRFNEKLDYSVKSPNYVGPNWYAETIKKQLPLFTNYYTYPRNVIVLYGVDKMNKYDVAWSNETLLNRKYREALDIINKKNLSETEYKQVSRYFRKEQTNALDYYLKNKLYTDGAVMLNGK